MCSFSVLFSLYNQGHNLCFYKAPFQHVFHFSPSIFTIRLNSSFTLYLHFVTICLYKPKQNGQFHYYNIVWVILKSCVLCSLGFGDNTLHLRANIYYQNVKKIRINTLMYFLFYSISAAWHKMVMNAQGMFTPFRFHRTWCLPWLMCA